ncbi:Thioredoxin domain-containing protein 17 [Trichinella pseudospiralis]|uniref:Thioredoxin domain-containing protein 17 n=1 Tax=Trichinella pseudospiralis TaxID=6337 RepID=A0A0V1K1F3_TRIPS|nr:Thioredoxin domain-containing protein 17 [Trichinella pseudospiralis]KRY86049.1 Thioredoxin domain-containing protein 17 [Trichinella pseudospiralis]KRZ41022.1 Thioredoxin domain-containing protein 17 [Trichinella pseudospiralis]
MRSERGCGRSLTGDHSFTSSLGSMVAQPAQALLTVSLLEHKSDLLHSKYASKAPSTPESVTVRQRNRINPELRYVSTCRSLRQLASQVHSSYNIYVIFCGTRNQWGYSWCPMCTALEHYVKQLAYYVPEETLLIYVDVGTLEQFQDESNCFRKDEVVKLRRVPTLMNWRTGERLVENESVDFSKLMKFMGLEKLH